MRLAHVFAPLLVPSLLGMSAPVSIPSTQTSNKPDAYVIDLFSAPTAEDVEDEAPQSEDSDVNPDVSDAPTITEDEAPTLDAPDGELTGEPQHDSTDPVDEVPAPSTDPEDGEQYEPVEPSEPIGDIVVDEDGIVLTDNVSIFTQATLDTDDFDLISAPLDTEEFNVAAVTWTGATPASVEIRTLTEGVWSDWYSLDFETADGASGTEPYISGGANGVQVRSMFAGEPAQFELVLLTGSGTQREVHEDNPEIAVDLPAVGTDVEAAVNNVSTTDMMDGVANNAIYSVSDSDSAVSDISFKTQKNEPRNIVAPAMVSRAQWGAPAKARWSPESAKLEGAVIHHTAGNNTYTRQQAPSVVSGIRYYHDVTLGWGDIGYNFLVDKYGTIYEGREGSAASADGQMVIGGHARPANSHTVGISILGNYTSVQPSTASINAVADIIAWQFGRAGISVWGTWNHQSLGRLNTIVGHNQVAATACPALISGHFGAIRNRAGTTINSAIALSPELQSQELSITPNLIYSAVAQTNVRENPEPSSKSLVRLEPGAMVTTTSLAVDNAHGRWWQVTIGTNRGWVLQKDLLRFDINPAFGVSGTARVWVNSNTYGFDLANTSARVSARMLRSDLVQTTGRVSGRFSEITFDNGNHWVLTERLSSSFVGDYIPVPKNVTFGANGYLILRSNPFPTSAAKRSATSSAMVITTGRSFKHRDTSWIHVRIGETDGWVEREKLVHYKHHSLYSSSPLSGPRQTKVSCGVFDAASPSANIVQRLARFDTVQLLGERFGSFELVQLDSGLGWVRTAIILE